MQDMSAPTLPFAKPVPRVVVLILNWNGWANTIECVESVRASHYDNFHVVVIDNHSDDDSVARIRAACPRVDVLETGANLGYAGGNNVGFEYAATLDADYVVVLNNDVTVAPCCLFSLVEAGEQDAKTGVIGSFVFKYDSADIPDTATNFLYAGIRAPQRLNVPQMANYHREDVLPALASDLPVAVDSAHGCAFAIKRQALAAVKGFDPAFFAVHEEVDFCMRAREAGWNVVSAPLAHVYHKVGASFGKQSANRVYYDIRNRVHYFANRACAQGKRLPAEFWARYLVSGAGRVVKSLLRGEPVLAGAVFQGTFDGLRSIGGKRRCDG